ETATKTGRDQMTNHQMFSPEALAAFRRFRKIDEATRQRSYCPQGAFDQSMRDRHRLGTDDHRKLLSSFAAKLPAADRMRFKHAIDQAFGEMDDEDDEFFAQRENEPEYEDQLGDDPYAPEQQRDERDVAQDFDNPSNPSNQTIGGPRPFRGMPVRG